MATVISVRGVGKKYNLGATLGHDTLRDHLAHLAGSLVGKKRVKEEKGESFWALKDVSFDVPEGEIVGVIGRNGAGKSTLLKILSQITEPTEGEIRIQGRMASLLEVGTGFHPELSGRENIFLNGAILGMTRVEIQSKFDEIVAFAEVEKFLDTPVKRYSSGMYVRLAFAVAAHLEPEILVVDEVLAVGDAQFQQKCLGKMGKVAREGRTVLFVSHNMVALSAICQSAVLLEKGRVAFQGSIREGIDRYLGSVQLGRNPVQFAPVKSPVTFLDAAVIGDSGESREVFSIATPLKVKLRYEVLEPVNKLQVVCHLWTMQKVHVLATADIDCSPELCDNRARGIYEAEIDLPPGLFGPGVYQINVACGIPNVRVLDEREGPIFELTAGNSHMANWSKARQDVIVALQMPWRTTHLQPAKVS